MSGIAIIGLDLAKQVLQLRGTSLTGQLPA